MAGIEIRGLTKSYRTDQRALDGLDLDVAPGELVVLVGPSGSGKTTLLRLLAGLEKSSAGTIRIGGKDVAGVPPHKRNVALVFQNLALYDHLTVAGNLAFGLDRKLAEDRQTAIHQTAAMLGLSNLLDRYPAQLSGGEQQRVALGRAIVRRPATLLLDEPLSSLDAPVRRSLRRELKRLQRELAVPTIYVTHDQAEALALGDRIAVLDRGRLQQIGTPDEVYRRPANRFVAEFFGPQGMNWMEGKLYKKEGVAGLVGEGFSLVIPANDWPDARIDRPIAAGVRPEDIEIVSAEDKSPCSAVGHLEAVEEAGDASYLHIRLRSHPRLPGVPHGEPPRIVVRSRGIRYVIGDLVYMNLPQKGLHWFDTVTGARLGLAPRDLDSPHHDKMEQLRNAVV